MASNRSSRRTRLAAWVEETGTTAITEAEWAELRARLTPVSDSYLRRLLRDTGLPLSPLVEGVRQDSLEELGRTLLALEREYTAGDLERRRACRRIVIEAKQHARYALRRGKAEKEEMILWMLTWLENPGVFPEWVALRQRAVSPPRFPGC